MSTHLSDSALITRVVARGDQHAYRQLVLRYQSSVRGWARRLCQDAPHLADDLAQETFIKAYQALPAFRDEAKFSTWLYRIAFNIAANRWRTKKLQWSGLDEQKIPSTDDSEPDNVELVRDLQTAMNQLSAPRQLAIRLCFEEGFSHAEVADIMGLPLGTVKTHVRRGKQQLQQILASWRSE